MKLKDFFFKKNKLQIGGYRSDVSSNRFYDYFNSDDKKLEIHKWHHYFPIYHKHFSRFYDVKVNMLEIGVDEGGSLQMWKKCFKKGSKFFGVDINENCKKFEDEDVTIFIGDQSDPKFWQETIKKMPKLDIVIDDGGHTCKQQLVTFEEVYDKISDSGVYLVEDLHTNYWSNYVDTEDKRTFVDFAKERTDDLNEWFVKNDFDYFGKHPRKRKETTLSTFTNITDSISFYNSIIVFEKQRGLQPFAERKFPKLKK
jgi:23S rRNA U2552 (ribose-2'-O)-methylase RlmE/FtsJ